VRVWVDITDAAHVVLFAPIVRRLEGAGHTVTITARRFADADNLLHRYGLGAVLTGQHRGGSFGARAVGLLNRTAQLLGSASSGHFDVAFGSHASDFAFTAWTLGIPQMTFLDDQRLRRTNVANVRFVDEVAVPMALSPATLAALGAPPDKLFRYPGFREEYYLYDFSPHPAALTSLGVDRRRIVGVVRPPRSAATRQAGAPLSEGLLAELARGLSGRRKVTLVLVARDPDQRRRFSALGIPGLVAPDGPVDGVGVIGAADFVLGAGGVMTREAAALGTPAYTVSRMPPTAVEAVLLSEGRLHYAAGPDDVRLAKKDARTAACTSRDPQLFVDRLLELASHSSRRARVRELARDAADGDTPPLV